MYYYIILLKIAIIFSVNANVVIIRSLINYLRLLSIRSFIEDRSHNNI